MNRNLLSLFIIFYASVSFAQISNLPFTETFSQAFVTGKEVEFIPNWYGNEVKINSRIFQTSDKALAMVPTSTFEPKVSANLNLATKQNVAITFQARNVRNGDGDRPSNLYVETSTDGGFSWNTKHLIQTFENESGSYNTYRYVLAGIADGKNGVSIRFTAQRGEGEGTAAQINIDNVKFYEEANDVTPPEVVSIIAQTATQIQVKYNDKMGTSAANIANYQGLPNLSSITTSSDKSTYTLKFSSPYGIAKLFNLTISNVADKAGNLIGMPYSQEVIYNNLNPNIFISEIMYHSPAEDDSLEYIEIYNKGPQTALLGGLKFSAGIGFTFPEYSLASGDFLLIAKNAAAASSVYGQPFLQWESGALDNSGEKLEIRNSNNLVVSSVTYAPEWGGDGNGHSISYCFPINQSSNNDPYNWSSTQHKLNVKVNNVSIYASPKSGCSSEKPEIRFNTYSSIGYEDGKQIQIQLILVNPNVNQSQVTLSIDNSSTATWGSDYSSSKTFPLVVNFPTNTKLVNVDFQIFVDSKREDIEQIVLKLSNPQNAVIGGNGAHVIHILDNDADLSRVCINELSSSNNSESGVVDEFDDADDWIELKNGSNHVMNLAGYYVTDDSKDLTKWRLPLTNLSELAIPANGYLILWADNEPSEGPNHLDFALSASKGEFFALVKPDGKTIVDSVSFPPLNSNTSYGRTSDCSASWIVFQSPTFKAANLATAIIEREGAKKIVLYPNPNAGTMLYISEPITYSIYNLMGSMIKRGEKIQSIDLSDFTSGVYLLTTDDGYTAKFIISR